MVYQVMGTDVCMGDHKVSESNKVRPPSFVVAVDDYGVLLQPVALWFRLVPTAGMFPFACAAKDEELKNASRARSSRLLSGCPTCHIL